MAERQSCRRPGQLRLALAHHPHPRSDPYKSSAPAILRLAPASCLWVSVACRMRRKQGTSKRCQMVCWPFLDSLLSIVSPFAAGLCC
ncbi:hypothetical protein M440DRAFT_1256617 [Trichoderma longibrachiatum ATCC 18648]|uniref:Uncharacterized protein n=1 Tax=Trichoderma longibrachiatum ATCC 18648 TaxID=983965 RepID=A0A2T4C1T4_TRILO|nr:hypothetical protein M440DRAFT_1256617 [Trichoderma longibrachiatum ATCC 18648]